MEESKSGELTSISWRMLGTAVVGLSRLAVVSTEGLIPLMSTIILETEKGFVTFSYSQEGFDVRGPERYEEIRWNVEPGLIMGRHGVAEEWLSLTPLEDHVEVPELPFLVDAVTGWFGIGGFRDTFAIILRSGSQALVAMTTDEFDIYVSNSQAARARAELVAKNMGLTFVEEEHRL
ncbi:MULTISPECIES: hypothetical protein [unclassified Nocardia]|uniref:hypothetical protein n=1 Tax=unclassified Nocardia TaxID=2637762 RepID=UPI0024A80B63|nr:MULTISPECIES: hypothetical protein [unclassified Nocardia]